MEVRYIKLGEAGKWERTCIEENVVRLDYISPFHQECLNGDWEVVRNHWLGIRGNNQGAATRDVNQIREFYELPESCIWITFYKRKLYWCCAYKEVEELSDGGRIRRVIGSWSSVGKTGRSLSIENLDGRVTKVQGFRGTICKVEQKEYLIRKINGEEQPDVLQAKQTLEELKENVEQLIIGLWWNDFELLVDLIFSKSGWQRISVLGKTEKDIDLDVFSPVTQKRAFVQVKSKTSLIQFKEYCELFEDYTQYDEMYYVFHSSQGDFNINEYKSQKITCWDVSRVAELVISAGLIGWLLEKRT